jgi:hypothetical protein
MIESSVRRVRDLLVHPFETFEELKSATLTETYRHYVLLLLIYSLLIGIVSVSTVYMTLYDILIHYGTIPLVGPFLTAKIDLFRPLIINWSVFIVYLSFCILLFAIFIKGLFIHAFVILLGGKQGVVRTIQILMYAATPFFLLGWIPYVAVFGLVWAVLLCIIGLMVLQEMEVWKAVAVVVIPTILVIGGLFTGFLMTINLISAISHIV